MSAARMLAAYRVIFSTLILVASAQTLIVLLDRTHSRAQHG